MRLVLVVVQSADVDPLLGELTELGLAATQIQEDTPIGGGGLAALIVGVDDDQVGDVVSVVHARARGRARRIDPLRPIAGRAETWVPGPFEQGAGGASVFVIPVRRFERIGYA